jgi:hypothetical protein
MAYLDLAKQAISKLQGYETNELNEAITDADHGTDYEKNELNETIAPVPDAGAGHPAPASHIDDGERLAAACETAAAALW